MDNFSRTNGHAGSTPASASPISGSISTKSPHSSETSLHEQRCCWVTLVTKPSYLPGALILAHSLAKQGSAFPLLVVYTSSLGSNAIKILETEEQRIGSNHIQSHQVELLLPRTGQENTGSVAERFKDTFTKLRVFELYKLGYEKCVFLDADMAVYHNPDEFMFTPLPGRDWIAACPACVCNLDHDPWAPSEWTKGNCAYTTITSPDGVTAELKGNKSRPTYHLLNSGTLVFHPNEDLWIEMRKYFDTTDKLKEYQFPDQDFLIDFFRDRWTQASWKYNAIKTMRYWHPRMWSDDEVVVLHYIVDKPWERRIGENGIAGHLGRDKETHSWWWKLFEEWHTDVERAESKETRSLLDTVDGLIDRSPPYTEMTPLKQDPGKPEDIKPWP